MGSRENSGGKNANREAISECENTTNYSQLLTFLQQPNCTDNSRTKISVALICFVVGRKTTKRLVVRPPYWMFGDELLSLLLICFGFQCWEANMIN